MSGGQREDRNGDRCTGCIHRSAQGNGNGVHVRIKAQSFTEGKIHRDIGGAASGEECIDSAFPDGGHDERIGIPPDMEIHKKGIDDKGDGGISANQHGQKMEITEECRNTVTSD